MIYEKKYWVIQVTLPLKLESEDFRFYKTLHEDVLLKPNTHNQWDVQFDNGDWVNVTGHESLKNAICIAIMTRFQELDMPLYKDFGCRIHELIKMNTSNMTLYKMELFIEDVLKQMRRIQKINSISVEESVGGDVFRYCVSFSITSISDELIEGSVNV